MKVTFEGTLTEIKKEIAIFLWEGSIWATKEEIETGRLLTKEEVAE